MERDEPALVPQWYKSASGNTSNNGLRTSSFRRSDGNSVEHGSTNRLLEDTDKNLRRSLSSNCSTNRDRGSSSRSQAYSSFRRSRDRNQDKDFDSRDRDTRSLFHSNGFDYLDPFLGASAEKDALRRSQSMIAERPPKKLGNSANNSAPSRGTNIASISKTSFEKEFPSLRAEERQGLSDTASATLHGPRTAVQSLPLAAPVIIGTSALAQVPVQVETNGTINSPIVKAPSISQASTAGGSTMTGLNMAEALTQTPSQVGDVSQLSSNTHRIEELALRKCKQLIPVTPSMPKTLSSNSSEKTKSKATRGGDFTSHNKVHHQQAHQNLNVRPPTGSDGAKTTQVGNFQVLNREKNGIRDGKSVINPTSLVPSAGVPSLKSPTDQKLRVEKNGGERKLTSHAQNRNDFFNLLRKKSLARSSVTPEPCSLDRSLSSEKSDAEDVQMSSPVNLRRKNGNCLAGDLFASDGSERYYTGNGETNPYLDIVVDPEEEAFLQSLGWDKNAWEEALTKEEIDAFLKKYEKQVPLKIVPEYVGGSQFSGSDA